jgi:putative transcriptional regulator
MFSENLKTLRKAKGLTQEELAIRLNVVRQTVSKWEKGLSVPDADLLIRLAEVVEVSVSEMLGARIENERELTAVAEQLSRINEQLAVRNRRARRIWKIVAIVLIAFAAVNIVLVVSAMVAFNNNKFASGVAAVETTGEEAKEWQEKRNEPGQVMRIMKVTSEQVRQVAADMKYDEIINLRGETSDVGSGVYILRYEVDGEYMLDIPLTSLDTPCGYSGEDLLASMQPK